MQQNVFGARTLVIPFTVKRSSDRQENVASKAASTAPASSAPDAQADASPAGATRTGPADAPA